MHRIAIVGAGPIGLEAAIYGRELGYDVQIIEKDTIGANLLAWGHVTLFSPWGINHSPLTTSLLKQYEPDWQEPEPERYLTGREYVENYLCAIARLPQLKDRIKTGTQVKYIARDAALKSDHIGDPVRTNHPFRLLLTNRAGDELTQKANALASGAPGIEYWNESWVEEIKYSAQDSTFLVQVRRQNGRQSVTVDRIVALVGYSPDNSIYRELQVHECYASRGPMKLAAELLGASSGDCMTQSNSGPETLRNPEPGFFIIGNKSYGRNPTFLLRTGLKQISDVFKLITSDIELNLYDEVNQLAC